MRSRDPRNPRDACQTGSIGVRRDGIVAVGERDQKAGTQFIGHRRKTPRQPVVLTSGALELLRILAEHPDRILDRDLLPDLLKGYERSPFERSIDVQIARLRAKIEPDTKHPRYIRTIWGKGYLFTPAGDAWSGLRA